MAATLKKKSDDVNLVNDLYVFLKDHNIAPKEADAIFTKIKEMNLVIDQLYAIDLNSIDTAALNFFANYDWDNKGLEKHLKAFVALRHTMKFPYCQCKECLSEFRKAHQK